MYIKRACICILLLSTCLCIAACAKEADDKPALGTDEKTTTIVDNMPASKALFYATLDKAVDDVVTDGTEADAVLNSVKVVVLVVPSCRVLVTIASRFIISIV